MGECAVLFSSGPRCPENIFQASIASSDGLWPLLVYSLHCAFHLMPCMGLLVGLISDEAMYITVLTDYKLMVNHCKFYFPMIRVSVSYTGCSKNGIDLVRPTAATIQD